MAVQDGLISGSNPQTDGGHSNPYLASLIWGAKWDFPPGETTITFAFDNGVVGYASFTNAEKDAFRQIVQNFEVVCNVDFAEVSPSQASDILWMKDIRPPFGPMPPDVLGFHEVPDGTTTEPLYGVFNDDYAIWQNVSTQGSFFYGVVIHELGHAMGLAHPHDGGTQTDGATFPGVTDGDPTDLGTNNLNQGIWTVMSYNDGWDLAPGVNNTGSGPSYGWSGTLMAFDIAALQYLYGANNNYKTGNDTYTLVNANGNGTFWSCIWDAGGIDTISNEFSNTASIINLNDAPLTGADAGGFVSRVNGIIGGFTIANGAIIENAIGGSATDTIYGNEFANKLEGRGGNDIINGDGGDDTIIGGDGGDTLYGGNGADTISGEGNDDTLYGNAGNDTLNGGDGFDKLYGGADNDILNGGGLLDTLYGDAGNDELNGGDSSDTLYGGANDDTLNGGAGGDYLSGDDNNDILNGDEGDDYLSGGAGDDILNGGAGFDLYYADGSVGITVTFSGDGVYDVGRGKDTLISIEGFSGTSYSDKLSTTIAARINGSGGDDFIEGSSGGDVLDGGSNGLAGDTLSYANATGSVTVDLAQTTINVTGEQSDVFSGFENFIGSDFADEITGNAFANKLEGGGGDDQLNGADGNDTLWGGLGSDKFSVGQSYGNDTISDFEVSEGDVIVLLSHAWIQSLVDLISSGMLRESGSDTQIDFGGNSVLLLGVSLGELTESSFDFFEPNLIVGTSGNDIINLTQTVPGQPFATFGADYILGHEGNDVIHAVDGNDLIDGGAGDDTMVGGAGIDAVAYDSASAGVTVSLALTSKQDTKGAGQDTLSEFENIIGSAFNDELTGNASNNVLEGRAGDDLLIGGNGADVFIGGQGDDTVSYSSLFGSVTIALDGSVASASADGTANGDEFDGIENVTGAGAADRLTGDSVANVLIGLGGADILNGGGGDDTLIGGEGADMLTGGTGSDRFVVGGTDTISDFEASEGDVIVLPSYAWIQSLVDLISSGMLRESGSDTQIDFGGNSVLLLGVSLGELTESSFDFFEPNLIVGTSGNDIINLTQTVPGQPFATSGADYILGHEGNDVIHAVDGNDLIDGGAGDDTMVGGAGIDAVAYVSASAGVAVSLALTSKQDTKGAGQDTLSEFENIIGSAFNDELTGNASNNVLDGRAGDDLLIGGNGADVFIGGQGSDTVSYLSGLSVTIALDGSVPNSGASGNAAFGDKFDGIENVIGGWGDDKLTGDSAANVLSGLGGNDTLNGGKGDDTLIGGEGSDSLTGGTGGDRFVIGRYEYDNGRDEIHDFNAAEGDVIVLTSLSWLQSLDELIASGTLRVAGNDLEFLFGWGSAILTGVSLQDLSDASFEFYQANKIVGTAGNDTINTKTTVSGQPFATNSEDYIQGLDGDDIIDGGDGHDVIEGGAGNDRLNSGSKYQSDVVTYQSATSGVVVTLASTAIQDTKGAGRDTLYGFHNLTGSAFDDILTGDVQANRLVGGDGNDILIGGVANDTLIGGDNGAFGDTASYLGMTGTISANLALGVGWDASGRRDYYTGIENLTGGSGADELIGDDKDNRLDGAGGNDKISGAGGNDILIGGAGADTLIGGADIDTASYETSRSGVTVVLDGVTLGKGGDAAGDKIGADIENVIGSAKNDKLTGNAGANKLEGGAGNDTLDGSAGDDTLDGGIGNDTFIGGLGADKMDGGDGTDTADYRNATGHIYVDLSVGLGYSSSDSKDDTFVNIENVTGGDFGNLLVGTDGSNILIGGSGGDLLVGNPNYAAASDKLFGLGGDDTMYGFIGDTLDGGTGNDTLLASTLAFGTITINLARNTFSSGKTVSKIAGFENVTGGLAQNVIIGNALVNRLLGADRADVIDGGAGGDTLDGGTALDTVTYAASNAAVTIDLTKQGTSANNNDAPEHQYGGHAEGDKLYRFENVVGSRYADKLTGDNNNNVIEGGLGNDILDGGNDSGGDGRDTISFAGATRAVTFSLASQHATTAQKTGGAGNDIAINFESILGGKGADKLTGDDGGNVIDGGAGNDVIEGGANLDVLIGGLGTDTLSYASSSASVFVYLSKQGTLAPDGSPLNPPSAIMQGGDAQGDLVWGFENLIGGASFDVLHGDDFANTIFGGGDYDTISGLGGNDILDGGGDGQNVVMYDYLAGDQHITITLGRVDANLNVAQTTTSGVAGDKDTIKNFFDVFGGAGNDVITGNTASNLLNGLNGSDRLFGLGSGDQLFGDEGDDYLEGGEGGDVLNGGNGADTAGYASSKLAVTVDLSTSVLSGGDAQDDTLTSIENLTGTAKHDTLTGDGNNNVIEGGLGDDLLEGNGDSGIGDTLSYAGATAAVTVDLALQGTQQNTRGGGKDTATGFEHLLGGKGNDVLTGDAGNNIISGGAGNDVLHGGNGGYDRLIGGAGADKMTAGLLGFSVQFLISGTDGIGDTYLGGTSDDSLVVTGAGSASLSKFDAGLSSIERLNGNTYGILGTNGADSFDFSHLNFIDSVPFFDGLGGSDKITGSFAADTIFGGVGNDVLSGGDGADHLHGGRGTDTLTGENGADTFHIKLGEGPDKIADFVSGVDTIEIEFTTQDNPLSLVQGSNHRGHAGPSAALVYDTDDGKLYYDSGSGSPVLIATLNGIPALGFADFSFV